jgi:prophage antirepressor-like protein
MNTDIQIFQNEQFGTIRTAGTADEPLFCLADVCKAVGIANARNVKSRLDEDDVRLVDITDNLGRLQQASFVTESGLYETIIRSDSETAKPFRKWVTSEVLPSIRKTGSYTVKNMSRKELALMIIQQEEEMEVLRLENKKKEDTLKEQKTKVVFADAIVGSKSSCLIGELAKIITQNGYEIGQNRLFAWMRMNHYLGTVGEYYNIPCQKYLEMGLFELKKNVHSQNGQMVTTITPKVTGKGQQYFVNKFLQEL